MNPGVTPESVSVSREVRSVELSRGQLVAIALLACVPLPLLSLAATVAPLPAAIDRAAASFIPFMASAPVEADGQVVRAPVPRARRVESRPRRPVRAATTRVSRVEPTTTRSAGRSQPETARPRTTTQVLQESAQADRSTATPVAPAADDSPAPAPEASAPEPSVKRPVGSSGKGADKGSQGASSGSGGKSNADKSQGLAKGHAQDSPAPADNGGAETGGSSNGGGNGGDNGGGNGGGNAQGGGRK